MLCHELNTLPHGVGKDVTLFALHPRKHRVGRRRTRRCGQGYLGEEVYLAFKIHKV